LGGVGARRPQAEHDAGGHRGAQAADLMAEGEE
jgi:hypothetical protein